MGSGLISGLALLGASMKSLEVTLETTTSLVILLNVTTCLEKTLRKA